MAGVSSSGRTFLFWPEFLVLTGFLVLAGVSKLVLTGVSNSGRSF